MARKSDSTSRQRALRSLHWSSLRSHRPHIHVLIWSVIQRICKLDIHTLFLAPIAWPIAKLLDYVLGHNEISTYKKAELKSFLQFHRSGEEPLRDDEISILNGVLELNTKNVETIMTPMKARPSMFALLVFKTDHITGCSYTGF